MTWTLDSLSHDDWLDFTFDHDVDLEALWHFDREWEWSCPSGVLVRRLTKLFLEPSVLSDRYGNGQLDQGFWIVPGPSGYVSSLLDGAVALDERISCLVALAQFLLGVGADWTDELPTSYQMWWDSVFAYTSLGEVELSDDTQILARMVETVGKQCRDDRPRVRAAGEHGREHARSMVQAVGGDELHDLVEKSLTRT